MMFLIQILPLLLNFKVHIFYKCLEHNFLSDFGQILFLALHTDFENYSVFRLSALRFLNILVQGFEIWHLVVICWLIASPENSIQWTSRRISDTPQRLLITIHCYQLSIYILIIKYIFSLSKYICYMILEDPSSRREVLKVHQYLTDTPQIKKKCSFFQYACA